MADFSPRALVLKVGGTDFSNAAKSAEVVSAATDSDFQSFTDAANGGARMYTLKMTVKQDGASSSLWYFCWSAAGTDVPVEVWPNGRPVSGNASPTQPKYTGTVTVSEPDGTLIGGESNPSNQAKFTTDLEWKFTAKPAMAIS